MIRALFHGFVKLTALPFYLIAMRPRYRYENKRVQSRRLRGGAILVSNHRSVYDVAVLMFAFPGRTLRCVVAELMFEKNPFLTLFLRLLGAIRVDRYSYDFSFLRKCERILSRGGVIEIYPEGRLPQPEDETPLPFKVGAVKLALQSGAPIVPVCHVGTHFGCGKLRVMIGEPIDVRALYRDDLSERENIRAINTIVREKIVEFQQKLEKEG